MAAGPVLQYAAAAAYLDIGVRTLRKLVADREVACVRQGAGVVPGR